ncbi:hypothetical protein [Limibacillus halophilus]|uniref:Endonuclease YncB(Thermonuclease family) n=1 Tax=Limibacillus halophilus TaxID=1579333 RepID=A0A839SVI0_9PROT|nr:hypothetical protein [Limibacillus halophilus]MBB3066482.1 endonuclease YncB(thermonuclease family) [Limibacillus halophilus]
MRILRTFGLACLLLLVDPGSPLSAEAYDPILSGKVTGVVDANTLQFAERRVQLAGVLPPTRGRPEHGQAQDLLHSLTQGEYVWCLLIQEERPEPLRGFCYVRGGLDLADVLVRRGLGRDCPRFSGGRYYLMETKSARRSMNMPDGCF